MQHSVRGRHHVCFEYTHTQGWMIQHLTLFTCSHGIPAMNSLWHGVPPRRGLCHSPVFEYPPGDDDHIIVELHAVVTRWLSSRVFARKPDDPEKGSSGVQ